MKKRLITGIAYIGVIVGFFFLRNIHPWFFGILVYAFSLIGTYEMVHAFSFRKAREDGSLEEPAFSMSAAQKVSVYAYAVLFTPIYYLVEYLFPSQGFRGLLNLSFLFGLVLLCLLVFDHKRSSLQGAGGAMLCGFYPTVILATMLLANDLPAGSTLALLIIFVISPVADTFAFVVGSIFKGKKLCPNISPNKTISGAIGGIVFGIGASVLLYWLYTLGSDYVYTGWGSEYAWAPWLVFALIGLVASVLTEFGDLAESIIKRKVGIKDMGKLLPGHGGILDRIDGTLFASTFVYIVFELLVLM
ncbi:MAG TPA: phosphatidate cytidylyltransferase [Candidatus Borkfalkia avistercoris]|uniref:Phosphatidate cytidylyltransferase n=1 Tax=Candidatus Borkfalkia avistercoris TaxID=2838504 RepID=A0A9D2CZM3_9FIRM|nr:phosphatidate cytidylyltransferase [Candidatus Borkfalkia avistercoris]